MSEENDDIWGIAFGDISVEAVVDLFTAWNVVDIGGYSDAGFVVL